MTSQALIFDSALLARRRDRIAEEIDGHDFLLQRVADDLAERLGVVRRAFPVAVDLGAHHGIVGRRIGGLAGTERLVSIEAAPRLLARCSGERIAGDAEALPLAEASVDLVVSGLSLQTINDLPGALVQIRRALRPDGLMLAAMLGGGTLRELRETFLAAEAEVEGGASPRVAPFADVRDLGGLLQRAGFALPVADSDTVQVAYPTPLALFQELKAMGCGNVLVGRRRSPLRRTTLARAAAIYAERFSRADGRVTATFEIVTLTGWAPHESQQQPLRPGSAKISLTEVLGKRESGPDEPSR